MAEDREGSIHFKVKQHSQTLLGFENENNTVSFINNINANNTDSDDDNQPLRTSITLMGFAQNENHEKPQYTINQDIMLFGKILQYNKHSKSYSIQLQSNSTNSSQPYTIQIPKEYIHSKPKIPSITYHSLDDQKTASDSKHNVTINNFEHDETHIKHTKNQNDITLYKDPYFDVRKDLKCILSLYASDAMNLEVEEDLDSVQKFYHNIYESSKPIGDICDNMFRISPFSDNKVLTNNTNDEILSVKQWVKYDEKYKIYYYHLGYSNTDPSNQIFFTPAFRWPNRKYSMAIWVNWKNNYLISSRLNTILTTFDSLKNAPIYVDQHGSIGVHSVSGRETVENFTVKKGWNFVVALGSRNKTEFYIGSLNYKPKLIGTVELSVCGQVTERIGERDQGPGKVGFIGVFEGHLNEKEMKQLHHESMSEMQGTWSQEQTDEIKKIILSFCDGIQDIAHVTISYAKYTLF